MLQELVNCGATEVVHGDARGADKCAKWAAEEMLGIPCHTHPADWDRYGKAAGSIRNQEMLDKHPDIGMVLAFPLPGSIGTWDMVGRARPDIPITVIVPLASQSPPTPPLASPGPLGGQSGPEGAE